MTLDIQPGAPVFPTMPDSTVPSTSTAMNEAIQQLQAKKNDWVKLAIPARITLLEQMIADFAAIAPRWVTASMQAKGIAPTSPLASEEWGAGAWAIANTLRQLRQSLLDILKTGHPHIPGPVTTRADGQVVAQVFPSRVYDRLFFTGVSAEIWMEPGISAEELPSTQAEAYQNKEHTGKVALVLGAGNVSSIGPLDVLYKLFVEDTVVLFKTNPVNAYLGPLLEECFHCLIDTGYLRVTYGGAIEGAYLCNHTGIDEIHITGSDKTFEAIVFGPGPEGAARKVARQPLLTKHITGELGNVSPVIIVPGPWSAGDLAYQAAHIVSMLTNNAGFNCNATRVIIQHADWDLRTPLIQQISRVLANIPPRAAYYPGAQQRQQAFVAAHPEAEQFGASNEQQLPWTFITDVDAKQENDICFSTEAFCSLFAETALAAENIPTYIDAAVTFANQHLWGTLSATILVHPTSLKDPAVAAAIERAIANLRYGTIGVNYWAAIGFILGITTWGAFPGHELSAIQSGTGVVHNTLMFAHPQKSVLRAPFRSIPTPPWFATQSKVANKVFPKLARFEANPVAWKVPDIVWSALGG